MLVFYQLVQCGFQRLAQAHAAIELVAHGGAPSLSQH